MQGWQEQVDRWNMFCTDSKKVLGVVVYVLPLFKKDRKCWLASPVTYTTLFFHMQLTHIITQHNGHKNTGVIHVRKLTIISFFPGMFLLEIYCVLRTKRWPGVLLQDKISHFACKDANVLDHFSHFWTATFELVKNGHFWYGKFAFIIEAGQF